MNKSLWLYRPALKAINGYRHNGAGILGCGVPHGRGVLNGFGVHHGSGAHHGCGVNHGARRSDDDDHKGDEIRELYVDLWFRRGEKFRLSTV